MERIYHYVESASVQQRGQVIVEIRYRDGESGDFFREKFHLHEATPQQKALRQRARSMPIDTDAYLEQSAIKLSKNPNGIKFNPPSKP